MYLVYFLLWVIFNGNFTLEICIFGLVIAGGLLAFSCRFMDYSLTKERKLYRKIFLFFRYCVLLVKEIVKANFGAMHLILTQREEIEPVLVTFHEDADGEGSAGQCDYPDAGNHHGYIGRLGIPGALPG